MKQFFIALALAAYAFSATPARAQVQAQDRVVIDVTAKGIDDAMKRLSDIPGNRQAQQAAIVLALLKGFGKPAGMEGGRQRLEYQIEATPDGRILINGIDVSVLVQAANRKP
jgi:hypothetical protein